MVTPKDDHVMMRSACHIAADMLQRVNRGTGTPFPSAAVQRQSLRQTLREMGCQSPIDSVALTSLHLGRPMVPGRRCALPLGWTTAASQSAISPIRSAHHQEGAFSSISG